MSRATAAGTVDSRYRSRDSLGTPAIRAGRGFDQDISAATDQRVQSHALAERHRLYRMGSGRDAYGVALVHRDRNRLVTGAIFARNPWNMAFGSRVAFRGHARRPERHDGDRARIYRPQRT